MNKTLIEQELEKGTENIINWKDGLFTYEKIMLALQKAREELRKKSWTVTKNKRAHLVVDLEDIDEAF